MVGRKKKALICEKGSHEKDCISKLPDHLLSEILSHLPTKDVVTTSVLSTRWTNLWLLVPGLDLDSAAFSSIDAFMSFADKLFDSHKESWIRKLRISHDRNCMLSLTQWINVVTTKRTIKHLDVADRSGCRPAVIPLSIYTCQTLVHLRLYWASLANVKFVYLPFLKILHLECITYVREATMEKLISGSPVLEDLTINFSIDNREVIQVRSQTLKRIHIGETIKVVIDAPLLQCLRTHFYSTKNYNIINLGFSTRLDIAVLSCHEAYDKSSIHDILADISMVRDLVLRNVSWKHIFIYSNSGPVLQFGNLSHLNATISKSDLEKLPTILESCPKLESLILELVKEPSTRHNKNRVPKVIMFSTVPECMVSSLKFVELKRSISAYEGETELIRYILKNSTVLEKLRLVNTYDTKKAKWAFLTEVVTMRRCSNACEVFVL